MSARTPLHALTLGLGAFTGLVLLVALAIGVAQYTGFRLDDERHDKVLDRPSPWLPEVRAREAAELGGYRWVDAKRGVLAIPLDRAAERVIAERGRP